MTTFYLVRHAAKAVVGHVLTGCAPHVHLAEEGYRDAARLAERLARERIDRIYSSPLERARETALPLARRIDRSVEVNTAFTEIDFGTWTNETVEALEPQPRWQQFNVFRSGARIPEGDRMLEVQTRFVCEMLRLHEAYPEAGIAIFSHSDPIRAAIAYFAGVPLDLFSRFEVDSPSISVITIGPWGPKIRCLNETLPPVNAS